LIKACNSNLITVCAKDSIMARVRPQGERGILGQDGMRMPVLHPHGERREATGQYVLPTWRRD